MEQFYQTIPFSQLKKDIPDDSNLFGEIEDRVDTYWKLKKLPKTLRKIAELKIEGYTNKEIAEKTKLSERTIYRKCQVLKEKML